MHYYISNWPCLLVQQNDTVKFDIVAYIKKANSLDICSSLHWHTSTDWLGLIVSVWLECVTQISF